MRSWLVLISKRFHPSIALGFAGNAFGRANSLRTSNSQPAARQPNNERAGHYVSEVALLSFLVLAACADSGSAEHPIATDSAGSGGGVANAGGASGSVELPAPAAGTGSQPKAAGSSAGSGVPVGGRKAPPQAGASGAGGVQADDASMPSGIDASTTQVDSGVVAPPSMPATFKVFDKIPMFGMYRQDDPKFTPPAGMLMWSHGTVFLAKLTAAQQQQIGSDLAAQITYHAQCDNYDRIGGVFFVVTASGKPPTEKDTRTELVRFITPFSDYMRGNLATYPFPKADIATYAHTLADPTHDVWIGIGGGSNPYDGDPCTSTNQPASFKEVGYLYSLELASTKPLTGSGSTLLTALYNVQAMKIPVEGTFTAMSELKGRVNVIVSGHGAEAGGDEYTHTQDTISVNGMQVGMFSTMIDCAQYAKFSPDGNQGIFRNNGSNNPRNWCPGSLVAPHVFEATLVPGMNAVKLDISPSQLPSGSYYATSISFSSP